MTSPHLVTTTPGVDDIAAALAARDAVACDLEADSMHHYREKVCLLQISTRDTTWIVDPLAGAAPHPLAPFFADSRVRKVFHGADYDVRSLHRDFGIEIVNLFDTMVAAQFLGEPEWGLAALLRRYFNVELDKRYQKADWSRRPLDPGMIDYAAKDTSLLLELYDLLVGELSRKGRLEWVEEECALLAGVRQAQRDDGPRFLRFKGAGKLERRALAVLEELLAYRDAAARRQDVPPFKILGNDTLREIAEKRPVVETELEGIPGLSEKGKIRHGKGILQAVRTGMNIPAAALPRYPMAERKKADPEVEKKLKRLKEWRTGKAAELAIEPGVLANNALLEALAELPEPQDLASIRSMRQWQRRLLGGEIRALLV